MDISREKYKEIHREFVNAKNVGTNNTAEKALILFCKTIKDCVNNSKTKPLIFSEFCYDPQLLFSTDSWDYSSKSANTHITAQGLLYEMLELADLEPKLSIDFENAILGLHASLSRGSEKDATIDSDVLMKMTEKLTSQLASGQTNTR